jgi:hypothetical protein
MFPSYNAKKSTSSSVYRFFADDPLPMFHFDRPLASVNVDFTCIVINRVSQINITSAAVESPIGFEYLEPVAHRVGDELHFSPFAVLFIASLR